MSNEIVEGLSWDDDLGEIDEQVSEESIKAAEDMGKVPVGKYLCRCADSIPKQKDFANYSCIAAGLRLEIIKALEKNGQPVKDEDSENYAGRSIFDDVSLYSSAEKDGMRNRRIMIASRFGLINSSADKITKSMWKTDIIGKLVVVEYIEEGYIPKSSTVERKIRKVAFDGYTSAEGIDTASLTPDIDDI